MKTLFCPYCGCGCTLLLEEGASGRLERTLQNPEDVISRGKPCIKGLTMHEVLYTNRVMAPMIRRGKQEKLEMCSWEEAVEYIRERVVRMKNEYGKRIRDHVYFVGSGEATNEANYLMSKLCRNYFGSNNIDSCARLCHSATTVALKQMFGLGAIPEHTIDDLEQGDLFVFFGTDPMEDYPVLYDRVQRARMQGASVVTVDVSQSGTSRQADHAFTISPGGLLPLISHLIVMVVDNKDASRDAKMFEGYDDFVHSARSVAMANPPSTYGFSAEDLELLYFCMKKAKRPVIGFGMGLTQHRNGTQNVYGVAGLALLMNAILFPNRGKVNVQGAGDVGADPDWRPREGFAWEMGWGSDFQDHEGRYLTDALYDDAVSFVWVMGMNPVQSLPDSNRLEHSLRNKFVIVQHHHMVNTMDFADVVLPATMVSDEYGSLTNGERRVRGMYGDSGKQNEAFSRKSTMGEDWDLKSNVEVVCDVGRALGMHGFEYSSVRDITSEMIRVVDGYEDLSVEAIESPKGQLACKIPQFKRFIPFRYDSSHFEGEGEYPYVLTTARNRFQFCSGSVSRNSKTLRHLAGEASVLVNPMDADVLGISDGDTVRIVSSAGRIHALAYRSADVEKRVIVAPFHFEKLVVNRLTPLVLDPESGTPCYKDVSVDIEKV